MSRPETYAEAPQEIRDAVEQLIKTYGSDPALLAGAIVSATCRAILAAKAEEREEKDVLLKALKAISQVDEIDIVLDPHWAIRVAGAALRDIRAIRKRREG